MDSLINKITLYDLTAMTLPGSILSLIIISLVPNEFKQIYKEGVMLQQEKQNLIKDYMETKQELQNLLDNI